MREDGMVNYPAASSGVSGSRPGMKRKTLFSGSASTLTPEGFSEFQAADAKYQAEFGEIAPTLADFRDAVATREGFDPSLYVVSVNVKVHVWTPVEEADHEAHEDR